jgi:hypothetical protein
MTAPRICLVTPSHVASNPRLVKEADALQAAGYAVHVVAQRYFPPLDAQDAAIFASARWSHTLVDTTVGLAPAAAKLQRRLLRRLFQLGWPLGPRAVATAQNAATTALAAAAARVPTDFYLGHCLAGLAAAGLAAQKTGRAYGFDAEDFHSAETEFAQHDPVEHAAITSIERTWLPGCRHLTAASPLIADTYARTYGVPLPAPVLNVFPRTEAPPAPVARPAPSAENPARIYWFSQTIGPDRGLEEIIPVLAALKTPAELHLRGFVTPEYRQALSAAALAAGLSRPPVFHDFAPMAEMVRLASAYDLGLSLEPSRPLNRELCIANKVFTYVLAGLPQLMSPTAAHRRLAPDLGPAAFLADLSEPTRLAARLDSWWADPAAVTASRRHAWHLGQSRYHWEHEQKNLLTALQTVLPLS